MNLFQLFTFKPSCNKLYKTMSIDSISRLSWLYRSLDCLFKPGVDLVSTTSIFHRPVAQNSTEKVRQIQPRLFRAFLLRQQLGCDSEFLRPQQHRKRRKRRKCRPKQSKLVDRRIRRRQRWKADTFVGQNSWRSRPFFLAHHVDHYFFHAMRICFHGGWSCQVIPSTFYFTSNHRNRHLA